MWLFTLYTGVYYTLVLYGTICVRQDFFDLGVYYTLAPYSMCEATFFDFGFDLCCFSLSV